MTSVVSRDICPAHHRGSAHGPLTDGLGRRGSAVTSSELDLDEVRTFLEQLYDETTPAVPLHRRWPEIRDEIAATGTYTHTSEELGFGARVAWRNSARCIGRLYWKSLRVRDLRDVRAPADVARECVTHLRESTRGGRIRSTISVFAPDRPGRPGPRIHNDQLVRYAGYRTRSGEVRGDGRHVALTDRALAAGWTPPEPRGRFDVLPLMISDGGPPGAPSGARRRRPRGPAGAPGAGVVRRPAAALARGARDQQHAAARSAGSPTPRHRSTAGTSTPRSARATSPTPTGTTSSR